MRYARVVCILSAEYANFRQIQAGEDDKRDWKIRRFWTADANPEDLPCMVDANAMRNGNPLAELADTGHRGHISTKPMSEFNSDVIDGERASLLGCGAGWSIGSRV